MIGCSTTAKKDTVVMVNIRRHRRHRGFLNLIHLEEVEGTTRREVQAPTTAMMVVVVVWEEIHSEVEIEEAARKTSTHSCFCSMNEEMNDLVVDLVADDLKKSKEWIVIKLAKMEHRESTGVVD
jgi:hypothetical protein